MVEAPISEGSHGEMSDSQVDEKITEHLPDEFPWQKKCRQNYLRQMGFSEAQKKDNVKSRRPEKWLFD